MTVYAYPVPGKKKSHDICAAFVAGCGGTVVTDGRLRDGDAFFYGITAEMEPLWRQVRSEHGRTFWYCDNAYFDEGRQTYFRVTKNQLQHSGFGRSDGARLSSLGVRMQPWRIAGDHIVVCPQSEHFMRVVVGHHGDWSRDIAVALAGLTRRTVVVRQWSADKGRLGATLRQDLAGAHALVTWSSAAAVAAVVAGVPVVTLGQCAAEPMSGSLARIERLPTPEREEWAGVLADNQWTLDEMRRGLAWSMLNG